MLLGDLVNPNIHQNHNHAGGEEGADGGVENVPALVVQLASLLASFALIQGKKRGERNDRRDHPDHNDGRLDPYRRALGSVGHGLGDGQIAVQCNRAQVHNGGSAEEDVERQVDVTPNGAECPVALQLIRQREGNNKGGHQDVCCRQRHQEEILRSLQGPRRQDGDDDQDVPHDGHHHHEGDGDGNARSGLWGVRRDPGRAAVAGLHTGREAGVPVGEPSEVRQAGRV